LALAAGQLVRIGLEAFLGFLDATSSSSSRMRACAALPPRPLCNSRVSPICFSMLCSGLSEVIGSWKIIAMRLPRSLRRVLADAPSSSWPR
jgi:hypothetical protein